MERDYSEFALLASGILSEEPKRAVSTEREITGCDSSQEPNLDTLNCSLEGSVALLTARCLASCLGALAYEPRYLNKCRRSGRRLRAACCSRSQGGQGQPGIPAAAAALSPVQKRKLGLFTLTGYVRTVVADTWVWCCLSPEL